MNVILETERLILRPTTMEDAEAAYQMNLDPEVTRYTHDGGVKSLAEIKEIFRTTTLADYAKYGYGRFAVEWKKTGRYIGFSGLKYLPDLKKVDLGYRFDSAFWGKGIATESGRAALKFGFEQLQLKEIIGMVLKGNHASMNVLNKLGFIKTKEFIEDDTPILYYTITPDDFK